MYFAGVHEKESDFIGRLVKGFRLVSTTRWMPTVVTIVAILDLRRDPQWLRESLNLRQ